MIDCRIAAGGRGVRTHPQGMGGDKWRSWRARRERVTLKRRGVRASGARPTQTPLEAGRAHLEAPVCTNCVQTDFYLAQFCEELFWSPATALQHLEALIRNPEFPKGDLHGSIMHDMSVPVTTTTCVDCNPLDEKEPPTQLRVPQSVSSDAQSISSQEQLKKSSPHPSFNYEKQRREIERQLINKIYDLVSDQQPGQAQASDNNPHRVTKLHVSEMAIQRMRNIKKINYSSQIERIKLKLLQSYRAFSRLDNFICQLNSTKEVIKVVPYLQKMKELEKSLQIKS